ncbi:MAG: hypothetical protein NXI10_03895 [bacterium]|nr:hypothetical protein [bacterium]
MKKKQLLTLLIVALPFIGSSQLQTPLKDAVNYHQAVMDGNFGIAKGILEKYHEDISAFETNHFINTEFLKDSANINLISTGPGTNNIQSGTDAFNLQGAIIDELGTLIANRFREELTIAFLEDFRTKLKEDTLFAHVFSNTNNVLMYGDPFNPSAWMSTFRTAMEKDLQEIPQNVPYILKAIEAKSGLSEGQKKALKYAQDIYPILLDLWKNPNSSNETIRNFISEMEGKLSDEKAKNSLKITNMFIDGLSSDGKGWVSPDHLNTASQNPKILKCFLGFVVEKNMDALMNMELEESGKSIYELCHKDGRNSTNEGVAFNSLEKQLMNSVKNLIPKVKAVHLAMQQIANAEMNQNLSFDSYAPLITASLDFLDELSSEDMIALVGESGLNEAKNIQKVLKYVNMSVRFSQSVKSDVESKNYSNIIVETMSLLQKIVEDDAQLLENKFLMEIMKYGSLAANLASAETSEEVSEALNAHVLPVGSYRLKRNNYFSVSINSYAGICGGAEFLSNSDAEHPTAGLLGFTAPVGVGLNWATKKKKSSYQLPTKRVLKADGSLDTNRTKYATGGSFSVFFTVVDVGAIAAFRLTDDETPVNDVQWSNILAPGMYLSWGIRNTPLAINVGGQYGPALRQVEANDGAATLTIDSRAFRVGVGLVVDIPLYNVYSRAEKIKKKKEE